MRSHFSVFTTLKAVNTSGKLLQSKSPASMKSLATKFTRFFYGEVKDIVEHRYSARYRAVHLLNVGINFCFILRFGYILLARHGQRPAALASLLPSDERHDIFVRIFSLDRVNEKGERDLSMVFTFIGLAVSSALLEVKLYFSRIDTLTWQMFYDLVVQNLDLYRQCVKEPPRRRAILAERVKALQNNNNSGRRRGSTSVLGLFTGVFARFRAATAIWYHLDYVDKEQLDERKLSSYPEMTLALRTRLIVALSIANKISCSCIITLYFSFTFFAAYYFFQIIEEFPPWYVPLVALELTYFSYMVIRILEILIFEANLASSSAILFISYIQEANVYLHEVLQQEKLGHSHHQITSRSNGGGGNYHQNGGPSSSGAKMATALWRFLARHTHISHQIIYAGQEMWAAVLMISMSYHIPNNAYLMIRLLQGSRTMVTWTVCIVQIVYILVTLLFLAAYSEVLHAAKNDLTAVQLLMTGRRHLGAKWKCLAIYELLNSGKQIGITIGPSNTITFRVVFEIVLYYFALLLFIMKSLR